MELIWQIKRDYYEVLGVSRDDDAAIKRHTGSLQREVPSDTNPGDKKEAEAEFKEASEAYAVLSDAENVVSMTSLDILHLKMEVPAAVALITATWEIFSAIYLAVEIFLGICFGGGSRRRNSNGPMRGADVRKSVRITFAESVKGTYEKIDVEFKTMSEV